MIVLFIAGKISSKLLMGKPVELIMAMPDYKTPQLKTVLYQNWDALKEFIYIASTIVIVSGVLTHGINLERRMPALYSFICLKKV